jgi:hypothetical protein
MSASKRRGHKKNRLPARGKAAFVASLQKKRKRKLCRPGAVFVTARAGRRVPASAKGEARRARKI